MIDFLFKKDLWILDLIISLIFNVFIGYFLFRDSMTGERDWIIILYGTTAYFITFVLAFYLQKKSMWIRSWMWLGIVGALARSVLLQAIYFPKLLDYYQRISSNISIEEISFDILKTIAFNWIFFAIIGLIFIFTARLLLYLFFRFFDFQYLRHDGIERTSK